MNAQAKTTNVTQVNWKVAGTVALFAAGLLLSGLMRYLSIHAENPPGISAHATLIYVGVTVFAAVLLSRIGVPMRRLGFGSPFRPVTFLVLAAVGVGFLQLSGVLLDPLAERLFGVTRDLGRFSDVAGSPSALIRLLLLNWSVAAFGEELAFRIVMMRGIAFALGDTRTAYGVALVGQAIVFGLVHAYQGPAGILGAGINALVFGGLTLAARGSIWPAALAHGSSNTLGIIELYLGG